MALHGGCPAGAEVLAESGGEIVAARQENVVAAAFHPELTDDTRLHEYFLGMCKAHGD